MFVVALLAPMVFGMSLHEAQFLANNPPMPMIIEGVYSNQRRLDYTWHGGMYDRCKECRFLELECKKECWDRIRDTGYYTYGGNRPRVQSWFSLSTI